MNNKLIGGVAVIALVLALIGLFIGKSSAPQTQDQPLGQAGGDTYAPCVSNNGVTTCSERRVFSTSSTTLASFKSPNATSTLRFAGGSIITASSTATQFEWGRSVFFDATTTSLGIYNLAANIKAFVLASSTTQYGSAAQSADPAFIIPPNTYVNLKAGNFGCTAGLTCSAIAGYAVAEFKY